MIAAPTAFEILAKQYRDWCTESFGVENGAPVAEDALATAKLAVADDDTIAPDVARGDYLLVWDRGSVPGPVGSKRRARLCAWTPACGPSLLHDVQDSVRVIWERVGGAS